MVEVISGTVPADGSGSGDGYGDGDGSGDGYGYGSYWLSTVRYFVAKMSDRAQARYSKVVSEDIPIAFWRSNASGRPANGGSGVVASEGAIHEAPGPLCLCESGTLHATRIPPKWEGERLWLVALHGKVIGDDEKLGCLRREIIGECL
jgi:hypothetical protein